MFNINHCFRKNEQILYREIEGGGVLIDRYRRTMIRLSPVALEIWQLLDGKNSVADIVEALKKIFEVDEEDLKRDVMGFLRDLARREVVI